MELRRTYHKLDARRHPGNPGHHYPARSSRFKKLFGDGKKLGMSLSYAKQPSPDGLAHAFLIGAEFTGVEPYAMTLGDNFGGNGPGVNLRTARERQDSAIERRHGISISAIGEVPYENGWISREELLFAAELYGKYFIAPS